MSKKPVISKEAQVLLKLLRIALGTEEASPKSSPEGKDLLSGLSVGQWKEVVRLSYEHKVSALAVDGLEASKYDPYKGLDEKESEKLRAVLVPWIKDVENTEWSYCYYVEVLKTLCQIFKDNELTPIILKGYGLSLNYPRPSHRGAGDIDVYLIDEKGNCVARKGNDIVRRELNQAIRHEDSLHHCVFDFKGILVENHLVLVSNSFTEEKDEYLRDMLHSVLVNENTTCDICPSIYLPSANFNAISLIQHMYAHFYYDKINMRQICDYNMFLRRHLRDIDWDFVKIALEKSKLDDFAAGINSLILEYLYCDSELTYVLNTNSEYGKHIICDVFKKFSDRTILNINHYFKDRWKIKHLFGENWVALTITSVFRHLLKSK